MQKISEAIRVTGDYGRLEVKATSPLPPTLPGVTSVEERERHIKQDLTQQVWSYLYGDIHAGLVEYRRKWAAEIPGTALTELQDLIDRVREYR